MIVLCEECGKKYRIDPVNVKGKGAWIRCRTCNHITVIPDPMVERVLNQASEAAPAPAPAPTAAPAPAMAAAPAPAESPGPIAVQATAVAGPTPIAATSVGGSTLIKAKMQGQSMVVKVLLYLLIPLAIIGAVIYYLSISNVMG